MKKWKQSLASLLCISMLLNLAAPAYGGSYDVPLQKQSLERESTPSDTDEDPFDEFGDGDLIDDLITATDSDMDLVDDEDLATPADWLDMELLEATPPNWKSIGGNSVILNDNYGNALPMHVGDTYELEIAGNYRDADLFFISNDMSVITIDNYGAIDAIGIGNALVTVYNSYYSSIATMEFEVFDDSVEIHTIQLHGNGGVFENGEDYMEIRGANNNTEYNMPVASCEGKIFKGWYSQPDGGIMENSGWWTTIWYSYTAYAQWDGQQYGIRFMDGDRVLNTIKVDHGSSLSPISAPYKEGYYFTGWMKNDYGTPVLYDFCTPVTEEFILYASWEAATNISGATVTVKGPHQYTGEEIKPEIEVKYGEKILREDVEYTISGNTGLKNAGDYTFSIHGINQYYGWVTVPFSIAARPITDAVITVEGRYTYTGYVINPEVTVLLDGNKIEKGWDTYTVTSFSKEVGDATVTVKGNQNFSGSTEVGFTILPALPENRNITIVNRNGGIEIPVHVGDAYRLEVEVTPSDYAQYVSFRSGDESVVKVDDDGTVTAVGAGYAYVYAKVAWDSKYSSEESVRFRVVDANQKVVTLELDTNGGTFEDGSTTWSRIVKAGDTVWSFGTPTHPDKLFGGWYSDPEGNSLVTTSNYYAPEEDIVLYAGWKDAYKIRFDYNGVSGDKGETEKAILVETGTKISYPRPTFPTDVSKTDGKLFVGWKTEQGDILTDTEVYHYIPTGDETITAQWTTDYYTVKFDYNGVTFMDEDSQTYYILPGKSVSNSPYFPLEPEQTEGKLFEYWMDDAGNKIDSIYNYVPEGDVTFTAQWTTDYYTITFDCNGVAYNGHGYVVYYVIHGDSINSMNSGPYFSDNPSETGGKKFLGWQTSDGNLYSSNEIYRYSPSRSEVITAQWSDYYTVTYDTNGGKFSYGKNFDYVAIGQALPHRTKPVKDGYDFVGWYEKESGAYIESQYYIPTSDITLVARWEEYWTVTFDANGGTYASDSYQSDKVLKGEGLYLNTSYGYKKDGSILVGWCEDKACKGSVLAGYYRPSSDTTLYAKWSDACTITLDAGEGYFTGGKKVSAVQAAVGKTVDSLSNPEHEGATFDGWYTKEGILWTRAYVATGDETFYARWLDTNCHTVTFHAGGPYLYDAKKQEYSLSILAQKVQHGYAIDSVNSSRGSYECEWYLDEAFKTPYNLSAVVESDLDLYAKWSKRISVAWDANGGTDNVGRGRGNIIVLQGSAAYIPNVYKDGYALEGWYTADGRLFQKQDYVYENISITARWQKGYKITLDLDGGRLYDNGYYPDVFYVKPGEACKYIPDPVKEDVAFIGWYDEAGNRVKSISGYKPQKDTVITARWTTDMVQVRTHGGGSYFNDSYSGDYKELLIYNIARGGSLSDQIYFTDPQKADGKIFTGWSLTEGGTEAIEERTHIFTEDTDLYPIWGECWVISVDYMGGFYNENVTRRTIHNVERGKPLGTPQDRYMTKPGYIFDGWYDNTDYTGTKYEIPFTPERNMMLYAKWTENNATKCTVTFDTAGGSEIAPQVVNQGSSAQEPDQPVKSGCVFLGWFSEPQYWNKYQFSDIVYKDITVYARWMETTDVNDATVEVKGTYTYTGDVIIPDLTVKMGYLTLNEGTDYEVIGENTEAGNAEVTIKGIGDYNGERKVAFTIEQAEMEVELPQGPIQSVYGDTATLKDLALPESWQWDKPSQKIGDVGTHTYRITHPAQNTNYKDKHAEIDVEVTPFAIDDAVIYFKMAQFTYTGEPIEPVIAQVQVGTVRIYANGYTVSHENNVNAGEATVILTGKGNYTGEVRKTFIIQKGDPEISIGNQVYEATYGQTLADIELPRGWSWQEPATEVGDVTGTGNRTFPADFATYEGCNYGDKYGAKLKVRVLPRPIANGDVALEEDSVIHDGQEKKVKVTVTCNGIELVEGSEKDYTVRYNNNIAVGQATVKVEGVNNYTGTVTKYFEIIADPYAIESATVVLDPDEADYTGDQIRPGTTVKLAGKTLKVDTEYTVAYGANIQPGLGSVTVTGVEPYHGFKTVYFLIQPAEEYLLTATYGDLLKEVELPDGWSWKTPDVYVGDVTGETARSFDASLTDGQSTVERGFKVKVLPKDIRDTTVTVNGEDIVYIPDVLAEPEVVVVDEALQQTLRENTDYGVSYTDNDQAGKASISVKGSGNYTGTVSRTFDIGQADPDVKIDSDKNDKIENEKMNLTIKDEPFFLYVGYSGDGEISFTSGDEGVFKVEKKYNDFLEANDGELTVTGLGTATLTIEISETRNYKGAKLVYDVIVSPVSIGVKDIRLEQDAYEYTGSQIKPSFEVVVNGETLEPKTDYTFVYGTNLTAGKEAGSVTVTGTGDYTGTVTATFEIMKAENPIPLPEETSAVYGQKLAELELANGWNWKTPDDYAGGIGANQHDVVLAETENYKEKTGQVMVQVTAKTLTESMVALEYESIEYDGTGREPVVTVTDGLLMTGNDYEVSYQNNLEAGTATVTVTGKNNYQGVVKKHFAIQKAVIREEAVTINGTYVYDGTRQKPEPVVVVGTVTLSKDTDYTVEYGDNINAGAEAGSVVITGQGNYTGRAEKQFEIEKAESLATPPNAVSAIYGQKLDEISLTDGWGWRTPDAYVGAAGQQQHEAVMPETDNYKEKVSSVEVKVAAKVLTESMVNLEYTETEYDGTEKYPIVAVIDGDLETSGSYDVAYQENLKVGAATVIVTGKNNYRGEIIKNFTITEGVIKEEHVLVNGSYTYDGTQQKPELAVVIGGHGLVEGIDYDVAYGENIHAGQEAGFVTVTGKGMYIGTVEKRFAIQKAENPVEVPGEVEAVYGQSLSSISLPDGWGWRTPDASVGNAGRNEIAVYLAATTDYLEKAGKVAVVVAPRELTDAMVFMKDQKFVYDGTEKQPPVIVKDAVELIAKDYQVKYEDNIHAGTAVAMITGTGNYQGTIRRHFTIDKATPKISVGEGLNIKKYLNSGSFSLQAECSNGGSLMYASSNEAVASVDSKGTVTMLTVGDTVITVSYEGDRDYERASVAVELTVVRRSSSGGGSSSGGSSSGGSGSGTAEHKSVPTGYTGQTKVIDRVEVPEYVVEGTWIQGADGSWKFTGKDGNAVANQWVAAYNPYANLTAGQSAFDWFMFDEKGDMITGWYTDANGETYYLNPASDNTRGRMVTGWWLIDGVYYYFNEAPDGKRGKMLKSAMQPN